MHIFKISTTTFSGKLLKMTVAKKTLQNIGLCVGVTQWPVGICTSNQEPPYIPMHSGVNKLKYEST